MTKEIDNNLPNGHVTQNGTYISYKTEMYGEFNSIFQKLHYELTQFLKKHDIKYVKKDFRICKAVESPRRKHCVTVMVESKDQTLPYSPDPIN